jgi:3-oxoacyl-[acyl-carrier protein] reductase
MLIIQTGGASGFGKAIATRFAQEGCSVLIADLNESGAEALASSLNAGDKVAVSKMDVTQESHWQDAVKKVVGAWGRLDIVVFTNPSGCTLQMY